MSFSSSGSGELSRYRMPGLGEVLGRQVLVLVTVCGLSRLGNLLTFLG